MSTTKEQTRQRLLEAARRLLVKRGFHDVALDDIAEAAGVSRQAVYKSHFTSKADLLLELVRYVHEAERLDELIEPIRSAESGLAMLDASIVAGIEIHDRVHELSMVLSAAALSDAGAAKAWQDRMNEKRTGLRVTVTRVQAEGHLAQGWSVDEAVDLLFVLTSVETYQRLVNENGWKPVQLIQRIREICEKNLLKTPKRQR